MTKNLSKRLSKPPVVPLIGDSDPALGAVFSDMRFMPTSGGSAAIPADFLVLPGVLAWGGSWLTPNAYVATGEYSRITNLASAAVAIAQSAR